VSLLRPHSANPYTSAVLGHTTGAHGHSKLEALPSAMQHDTAGHTVRAHPDRMHVLPMQSARDRRIAERRAQRKEEREYARKEEYARRCRAQVRKRQLVLARSQYVQPATMHAGLVCSEVILCL